MMLASAAGGYVELEQTHSNFPVALQASETDETPWTTLQNYHFTYNGRGR